MKSVRLMTFESSSSGESSIKTQSLMETKIIMNSEVIATERRSTGTKDGIATIKVTTLGPTRRRTSIVTIVTTILTPEMIEDAIRVPNAAAGWKLRPMSLGSELTAIVGPAHQLAMSPTDMTPNQRDIAMYQTDEKSLIVTSLIQRRALSPAIRIRSKTLDRRSQSAEDHDRGLRQTRRIKTVEGRHVDVQAHLITRRSGARTESDQSRVAKSVATSNTGTRREIKRVGATKMRASAIKTRRMENMRAEAKSTGARGSTKIKTTDANTELK